MPWSAGLGSVSVQAALDGVTAQQVQDVAKRYFGDEQLTVGTLIPTGQPSKPTAGAPTGELH